MIPPGQRWSGQQLPALAVISSCKMPGFVPYLPSFHCCYFCDSAVLRLLLPALEIQVARRTFSSRCLSPFLGTLLLQAALNAEVVPMMWVMRTPMLSCLFFPVSSLTPIWYFRPPVIISFCLFSVSLPSSHTGFLPW